MLWAHETYPTNFILCGPKYQFPSSDGTHLAAYDGQGELYAKAYYKYFEQGWWEPLRPILVSRLGATITVTFTNTGGFGMVLDTNAVPYVTNYGIIYEDDSGATPAISSVSLTGATTNQVQIVLASTPTGNKMISFGYPVAGMVSSGSPTNRPRTNIRNACTNLGFTTATNIYDWAVHSRKVVP